LNLAETSVVKSRPSVPHGAILFVEESQIIIVVFCAMRFAMPSAVL